MKVQTRLAEPADAQAYVRLVEDAFRVAPSWARPKDSAAFVEHTHSAANPSGRALVACAVDEGRITGHCSAIPWRFVRRDGSATIGWLVSCFAIAREAQGAGLGSALVDALLGAVAQRPGEFAFTHPNPRSRGVFVRHGGRVLDRSETLIVLPRSTRTLRAPDGTHLVCERIDASAARDVAARIPDSAPRRAAFVKDRAWFAWRHLGPDADRRVRLFRVHGGGEDFVLVVADHAARGARFTVLVDTWPEVAPERWSLVLHAARHAGGGRPVYLTTNLRLRASHDGIALRGAPWTIAVPRRLDPRPVDTMLFAAPSPLDAELAAAPVLTGDWMSF